MRNNFFTRTYFTMEDCGITKDELKKLCITPSKIAIDDFVNMFYAQYGTNWITFTDTYDDTEATPDDARVAKWTELFKYHFASTEDRYTKMIDLYQTQKGNLLNKVESASTLKFDDTPQDAGENADGFNTTITTNTFAADPGELMTRLKNIQDNYESIYRNWIREFSVLFGESVI